MTKLVKYDAMRQAVAEARSMDEVKDIADRAEAMRLYARQAHNPELELWTAEIRIRARRRLGQLSAELEKSAGGRPSKNSSQRREEFTKSDALKAAGVSKDVAARCEKLAEIPEGQFEEALAHLSAKDKAATADQVVMAVSRKCSEQKRAETLHQKPRKSAPKGLHLGDFRELAVDIPDESVHLVFTDPPYDKKSVELYEAAAEVAARVLKPGGSFVAYTGQSQLPRVLAACSEHLRYWWTFAGVHGGGQQMLKKLGVRCGWKPLVWFVKDTRGDVACVLRDVVDGRREKDAHDWQQAEGEATYFLEHLSKPGETVVDFFLGGGTTAVAAKKTKRLFVGYEIDPEAFERAASRLEDNE